ncbi:MAG TPA: hypothetical protein VFU64_07490 [Gaiellaceae bacterium]|nr:hypothetical protein [Gaiellaceae bacterium]
MLRSLGWLAWTIVAYLLGAAAFELSLALRDKTAPHGEGFVLLVALIALLVAAVLVFRGTGPAALFAPVAALFVTARFYTADPYYTPTVRSYSDGGVFSPTWIYALLGLALLAGATTQFWRRTASMASAVVLVLLAVTALYMGAGH